ncbi:hypothetical protein [Streptosporangium sp. NPDC049078]|uniref:hypothetical protein n=1 Tax=Streptosporangium sp. NPDC049078 TaxID=3155767 RepID=UPI003429CD90
MFSTSTISRITEELRLSQERVISLEREIEEARASSAEWSRLLSYAETTPGEAPVESGGELVAEQPPAPCFCGLPGVPGTLHGPNACVPDTPAPTPTLPFGSVWRGTFEPYTPAAPASDEQPGGQPG